MKPNHESMPNQAPEPGKPEFSEDDIDALVESFKEGRSEREMSEGAASIEGMIAETIAELDAEEERRARERAEREKGEKVERTGIVYTAAAKAAEGALAEQLGMALQLADSPEAATMLLAPAIEHLHKTLDPHGGFNKLHADPRIQELYGNYAEKIRHEAVVAMKTALENRIKASSDEAEKAGLRKLVVSVEAEDPGGDRE